jgi:hypothetical protein
MDDFYAPKYRTRVRRFKAPKALSILPQRHTSSRNRLGERTREWARQNVHNTYSGPVTLHGYKPRTPGRYPYPTTKTCMPGRYMLPRDVKTNEFVHISVRDRGYGATRGSKDILPGLKYVNCINDGGSWDSQGSWSSEESRS